jgi:hypothetical protein
MSYRNLDDPFALPFRRFAPSPSRLRNALHPTALVTTRARFAAIDYTLPDVPTG